MHATPIALSQLVVSNLNVRKTLDVGQEDSNIEELAASVREKGLLSPLTVRPLVDGRFEIVRASGDILPASLSQSTPYLVSSRKG